MKVFAATLATVYATGPSVTCNNEAGEVVMTAKVPKSAVQENMAAMDGWKLVDNNYVASWSSFDGKDFTVEEANRQNKDNKTYRALVISKKVDSEGCEKETVNGVTVCVKTGHTLDFECAYSLENQDLNTADFTVSGSDTEKSAKNTGKLGYTLDVNTDMTIGDKAAATITPKTKNLVIATVNSCSVSNEKEDSRVKLFDSNKAPQDNPLGVSIDVGSGKDILKFGWSSFKWSTTKVNNKDVIEDQELSCNIGLSLKKKDEVPTSDYPGQRCNWFGTHNNPSYPRAEVAEKCLEACKAKPGCAFSSFKYNKDATNIQCLHSTASQCKLVKAHAWDNFVVHSVAKANAEEEPAKEEEKEEEKPKEEPAGETYGYKSIFADGEKCMRYSYVKMVPRSDAVNKCNEVCKERASNCEPYCHLNGCTHTLFMNDVTKDEVKCHLANKCSSWPDKMVPKENWIVNAI